MKKNRGDLELNILTSLILKPELMSKIKVETKHFEKHQRLWIFMKAFYERFKTFDLELMYSTCKDKFQIMTSIEMLLDAEPSFECFDKYQDLLIERYNENRYEKWVILNVCELSDKLYLREINTSEYARKVAKIYKDGKELFKGGDKKDD